MRMLSHLCLSVFIVCSAFLHSLGQSNVSFYLDIKGKVKDVKQAAAAKDSYRFVFDDFVLVEPPFAADAQTRIDSATVRLLAAGSSPSIKDKMEESVNGVKKNFSNFYLNDDIYSIIDAGNKNTLEVVCQPGTGYEFSAGKYPSQWFVKRNVENIVLADYYNLLEHQNIPSAWLLLYNFQLQQYKLLDMIYQYRAVNKDPQLLSLLNTAIHQQFLPLQAHKEEMKSALSGLNDWIVKWVGLVDNDWPVCPLNIVDKGALKVMADTNRLSQEITDVNGILDKLSFGSAYHFQQQRRDLLNMRLQRLHEYAQQAALSEKTKDGFTFYTVLSQLNLPPGGKYQRYHDAGNKLSLFNADAVKKETDITNDDRVYFTVVNIPFDDKIVIEKKSTGFIVNKQATGLITEFVTGLAVKASNNNFLEDFANDTSLGRIINRLSIDKIEDCLHNDIAVIEPYLAYLPPTNEQIKPAKAPAFDGFKTKVDSIGPFEGDSSMDNSYRITVSAGDEGKTKKSEENKEPLVGTFKYKSFKKSRIQFVSSAHFFTGDAPVVKRKGETNEFTIESDRTLRYAVGVKVYLFKQTFSEINTWDKFFQKLGRSPHVMVSVDMESPLENFYFGIGPDLLPGLGLNVGAHLYRYTRYQIYNGEVVGEQKSYRFRKGIYIAITVDGSVLNQVFKSFLKLK